MTAESLPFPIIQFMSCMSSSLKESFKLFKWKKKKEMLKKCDGVGSHLTSPISRDARSCMTKTLETNADK